MKFRFKVMKFAFQVKKGSSVICPFSLPSLARLHCWLSGTLIGL